MECPVCLERYTSDASLLPKVMPCGHFTCAGCLSRVQICPKCRKEFTGPVDALPTAFDVIESRERSDGPSGWWCTECDAAASAQCRDNHPIIRVQEALRRQAAKLAPLASEAVQGLENAVQAAAEEPARLALQLLADGDAPAECELTVRRGGSAVGAQWWLEEGGAAGGLDRALICKLAAAGALESKPAVEAPPQAVEAPPQAVWAPPQAVWAPPQAAVLEAPVILELDMEFLRDEEVGERAEEKEELLHRVRRHGVRRIKGLSCHADRAWSLQLLKAATASLEELELWYPRPEHLLAAHTAPRLRRLYTYCRRSELEVDGQPLVLPAPAAPSILQWLRVRDLPRATLQSLLRAHAASLRTLLLCVGTPGNRDWPYSCSDLHALLGSCGLAALTKMQLLRPICAHTKAGCQKQMQALRRVLPAVTVQCDWCQEKGFDVESF